MNTLPQLAMEPYEGQLIPFNTGDAFVNATAMCAAFGKRPIDFLRLPGTKAFQNALAQDLNSLCENLTVTVNGGTAPGTWLHPDLALECARWLSPKFAIWCNRIIRRILSGDLAMTPAFAIPQTYAAALIVAGEQAAKAERLELENAKLAPKAATFDLAMNTDGLLSMDAAAKLLGDGHRNNLMKALKEKGVLLANNLPAQCYIDRGYFEAKQAIKTDRHGVVRVFPKAMVTQKGLDFLRRCKVRLAEARAKLEAQSKFPSVAARALLAPIAPGRSLVAEFRQHMEAAQ